MVKSTLKKRNIRMHRGRRACFFHLMQKYLCIKSHLSQINHYCLVTESKQLSVLVSYHMDVLLTLPGYSPFSGHINTLIQRNLGAHLLLCNCNIFTSVSCKSLRVLKLRQRLENKCAYLWKVICPSGSWVHL